jgi:hypothetical protein
MAKKSEKRLSDGSAGGSTSKRSKDAAGPSSDGAASSTTPVATASPSRTSAPPVAPAPAAASAPAFAAPPPADEDSMPHLCCSVCLSFPEAEVLQCCAGHIMCKECYERVCHEEKPSCPSCREPLDVFKPIRNMLAERSISMLSVRCPNAGCEKALTRGMLDTHVARECQYRQVCCKFAAIGCKWEGIAAAQAKHEDSCKRAETPGWKLLKRVLERQEAEKAKYEAELAEARAGLAVCDMLSSRCKNVEFTSVTCHKCSAHEHVAGKPAHCVSATFHAIGFRWKLFTVSEPTEKRFSAVLQLRDCRVPLRAEVFVLRGQPLPEDVKLKVSTTTHTFDHKHRSTDTVLLAEGGACDTLENLESITLRVGLIDKRSGRLDRGFMGQIVSGGGGMDGLDEWDDEEHSGEEDLGSGSESEFSSHSNHPGHFY